jgi:hypothetical protein
MTRKGQAITLSLSPEQKERLEEIAVAVGAGWGKKPNISELFRMIADGRVIIYKPGSPITTSDRDYFESQISELEAIVQNLKRL